jgi:Trypsin-like peptidase domain
MPPRRITALAVSLTLAMSPVISTAQGVAAISPPYNLEERAAAIASPSMVYIESWATGNLRRLGNGEAVNSEPIVLTYRCSGFVVTAQGHVATSGQCVQPEKDSYLQLAAEFLINDRIKKGTLPPELKDAYIKDLIDTTEFSGDLLGTKPMIKVYGQIFQGQGSLTKEPAMLAESVQIQSTEADIAVVKFAANGLPLVEISPDMLTLSTPIVSLGFAPDKFSDAANATYTLRSALAKVVGRYGTKTPPAYQIDADLGPYSRGGVVVDSGGRIVGMINADLTAKDHPSRVIIHTDHIRAALGTTAPSMLSPADRSYRAGLDAYFGGRYAEAIQNLDQVLDVTPQHALAKTYRSLAAERLAVEGGGGSGSGWMVTLLIILSIALLFCVAVIVWLVIRGRRVKPSPYAAYLPVSAAPVSGVGLGYGNVKVAAPVAAAGPLPDTGQYPIVTGLSEHNAAQTYDDPYQEQNPWAPPPSARE